MTAGLVISVAALVCSNLKAEFRAVAITVDDLPLVGPGSPAVATSVNTALLQAFKRRQVRAVGFVNEKKVRQIGTGHGRRILQNWLRQGMELGNHTFSHHDLNDLTPEAFREDLVRGETVLATALRERGQALRFFRFPFNHTGNTAAKREAVKAILAERGYAVAVCTIDNTDYEFARAYDLMLERRDKASAQRLITDYLSHTDAIIDYYVSLHQQIFGRETSHVMLLHANRLNAVVIERLLSLFTKKRFRFVTLSEAQSDPAYSGPEGPPTRFGPMWGYRWASEKHIRVDGSREPEPPLWIQKYGK